MGNKIMESIIRDHIVTYMSSNKLFSTAQHGFVPSRNCMTNLLLSMEDWAAALEYGYSIDIIYTDFQKRSTPSLINVYLRNYSQLGFKDNCYVG